VIKAGISGIVLLALIVLPASAAEKFLGAEIVSGPGTYLVLKDANVRAKPETKSKKIGTVKEGQRLSSSGIVHAGAGWVAVLRNGEPFGFVYATALMAVLDGTLAKDLTGSVRVEGGIDCDYTIRFRGRSNAEGEALEIADYDLTSNCRGGGAFYFWAPMFMTEGAYDLSDKQVYQISVDLLDIRDDLDNVFSTISLFDLKKKKVIFDSHTIKGFGVKNMPKDRPAGSVPKALGGAAEMALKSWNGKIWKTLAKMGG